VSDRRLRLRGFREDEFAVLFERLRGWKPEAVAADEAYWRALTEKRVSESGAWAEDGLDFAVEVDGRLAGAVQAVGRYYRLPPNVYELGIEFFDAADRGRGLGRMVLAEFVPLVFANDAIRLQGRTHVENSAMIRLFERLGFVHEGVLREIWPLDGLCGDMALYAMTRSDYERAFPPAERARGEPVA
jgi:RimJ/RimL family protein N-acetyltransferase